jgi:hypothetical protein
VLTRTNMKASINTRKVTGRRNLHFASLDEIVVDAERMECSANVRTLGNWSAAQIVQHIAMAMRYSIDGVPSKIPAPVRVVLRLLLKRRFLTKGVSPGFRVPTRSPESLPPATMKIDDALASLRTSVARLKSETRRATHPAIGRLTSEEWEQFHCRHAEMHMSFVVLDV